MHHRIEIDTQIHIINITPLVVLMCTGKNATFSKRTYSNKELQHNPKAPFPFFGGFPNYSTSSRPRLEDIHSLAVVLESAFGEGKMCHSERQVVVKCCRYIFFFRMNAYRRRFRFFILCFVFSHIYVFVSKLICIYLVLVCPSPTQGASA